MSRIPALFWAVVFSSVCVLSGCITGGGGGGGSSGNVAGESVNPVADNSSGGNAGDTVAGPELAVPVLTAMSNLVNNGYTKTFSITGNYDTTSKPITGSGSKTGDPAIAATVNGITLLKQVDVTTGSYSFDGNTFPLSTISDIYIDASTYANVFENAGGAYIEFPQFTWPSSAKAGDAAYFGNATLYSNSTKALITGTLQISYAVAADTASSLLFSTLSDQYDTSANHVYQSQSVYRITTAGGITPVSASSTYFSVNGSIPYNMTYTFQ